MSGDHGYDPFGFGPPNPAMEAEVAEIDEPQAELARLRAECEELRGSVKSKQNCLDAALEGWNKASARIERLRAVLRPYEDTAVTEGHRPGLARCPICRQCSYIASGIEHRPDCRAAAALKAEP